MNTKNILGNIKSLLNSGKLLEEEENKETITNVEMAKQEILPVDAPVAEAPVDEKPVLTDAERIDQLEKDVKELQKDLKDVQASLKPVEVAVKPVDEPIVAAMSAVVPIKKFDGAPIEEKTALAGIITRKTKDTQSRVFDRIANSKY